MLEVFTFASEQIIGPIFKGQEVDFTLEEGTKTVPKRR
jgi:hypothetical protein